LGELLLLLLLLGVLLLLRVLLLRVVGLLLLLVHDGDCPRGKHRKTASVFFLATTLTEFHTMHTPFYAFCLFFFF